MSGIIFSQASGLNDSVFGKSQEPIKSMITAGVESFEETSLLYKIFYMDKTKNFAEKYATMMPNSRYAMKMRKAKPGYFSV